MSTTTENPDVQEHIAALKSLGATITINGKPLNGDKPERDSQFVGALKYCDSGELVGELDEAIMSLVAACRRNGAKGKLTVTMTVIPRPGDQMIVVGDFKADEPKKPRNEAHFWSTDGGALVRQNPNQHNLPL